MKEEEERPPGFEASSLLPFPSSVRSLLGSQVEARHESGPQFSFYGPAGTDFGTRRCRARTRLKTTESPGPARYSTHNINPELVSTKKRQSTSHVFSAPRPASVPFVSLETVARAGRKASWNAKQIARLNRHRARQMDWPCSGGINPVFMEEKHTRQQYPRCHFGAQTTKRPFFGPLANSAGAASRQTSNVIPGALRRGSVRGVSSRGLL